MVVIVRVGRQGAPGWRTAAFDPVGECRRGREEPVTSGSAAAQPGASLVRTRVGTSVSARYSVSYPTVFKRGASASCHKRGDRVQAPERGTDAAQDLQAFGP